MLLSGCATGFTSWHQNLSVKERFEPVLDGEAILDRETGLVWQRTPSQGPVEWEIAVGGCYNVWVGGRRGWRVPARYEMLTLSEKTSMHQGLPVGHPFELPANDFWTANDHQGSLAWVFHANSGNVSLQEEVLELYAWCVRGGYIGYDAYGIDHP